MALPVPALVGITDTNALASRACNAARNSLAENLFTGLAVTGRSNTYISAHVPGELVRHLADVAEGHPGLDLREAERVLWNDVMPLVPVVDLAVGDYLHPRIQAVRRADPALPVRLRGDPDDLGTAALAEFLAPAAIISADSIFTRFGLANSVADTWLPLAHRLLQAADYEATLTEAAYALEVAVRLIAVPVSAVAAAARRRPLAALGIGGGHRPVRAAGRLPEARPAPGGRPGDPQGDCGGLRSVRQRYRRLRQGTPGPAGDRALRHADSRRTRRSPPGAFAAPTAPR
jgi:hypothetical protein